MNTPSIFSTYATNNPFAAVPQIATAASQVSKVTPSIFAPSTVAAPSIQLHSPAYYAVCGLGGILSCGLTHAMMTPVDLVKCNIQANPEKFKGTFSGLRTIIAEEGVMGLSRGWAPTLVGYSIQGLGKFGLYEFFKKKYADIVGPEIFANWNGVIYAAASGSAEFFADIGLCAFEATKVRVQTSPEFAKGLSDGLPKIYRQEGMNGLFKGLSPLWARQIPYTIVKFVAFEKIASAMYSVLPKPKSEMSKGEQLGVSLAAGYAAGVFCAIVSQAPDSIVSKLNKVQTDGGNMAAVKQIVAEEGLMSLATRGLGPRIFMIGTLTGFQWLIFDAVKTFFGLPSTGGVVKKN